MEELLEQRRKFVHNRVIELLSSLDKSLYRVSLDLGLNKNYFTNINNNTSHISLDVLIQLCEYLDISMQQFFDQQLYHPIEINKLNEVLTRLNKEELEELYRLLNHLTKDRVKTTKISTTRKMGGL